MSTLAELDRVSDLNHRADFPAIPADWSYLDSAATAQKPKSVIDAITKAYAVDYATVHRGVYSRSADMTIAYEQARSKIARFIGAASPDEIVFVRGATEAINLIAQSWGASHLKAGDRILLSVLEHHSNIVPWQILRERIGFEIDVVPLDEEGRIDLDAAAEMIRPDHKLVSFAHISNVLGSVLDVKKARQIADSVGAKLLIDGCQSAPHLSINVAELGCDFFVFSGHKLYGPTGIGVLWAKPDILSSMPPWQGGGAMIDQVTFEKTTFLDPPARFEAGTPNIVGTLGLAVAVDYLEKLGADAIARHEAELTIAARKRLKDIKGLRLLGPDDSAAIISFSIEGIHPHDIGTILDEEGVAIRAGHHCAQPLMTHLGVAATARASFGLYNEVKDIERLAAGLSRVVSIFL
ncbi:aminotransferase class V-fold PLP-dependent enzyme [Zymomonas mobilis]|uniref:Cysteine desulfurase n=1 Tax=Zymomonas mobilis subsp. pomaceae (strain ATCC 29192 / DSM 22645 / JCM 10191 / CCUG 17912 / NBRC 13757 / NCIMB 11200 / NRRL B-4491 / Barker I) TaxID=579138 RepID=F8ESA8_ZYMMT|nr:cysteine desulfurase [Zymomonas mobilis]AEI37683.1 cysteine desulfurase, SufS subfamily [Zymomonas mobilis subsp. pomaceae ATCC 29192]MDX5949050.1 cysteine desulfurase [Zymomonas mobilis subsp. pomaceae]GEB88855.1 cysteine desulfurase [Zymomonas mobilis subsp. pomaceae]